MLSLTTTNKISFDFFSIASKMSIRYMENKYIYFVVTKKASQCQRYLN